MIKNIILLGCIICIFSICISCPVSEADSDFKGTKNNNTLLSQECRRAAAATFHKEYGRGTTSVSDNNYAVNNANSYRDHYNTQWNTCFMLVKITHYKNNRMDFIERYLWNVSDNIIIGTSSVYISSHNMLNSYNGNISHKYTHESVRTPDQWDDFVDTLMTN